VARLRVAPFFVFKGYQISDISDREARKNKKKINAEVAEDTEFAEKS
jgi:hypothetical protein